VFRVDINNPREFKVLRSATDDQEPRWCPMGGANFWRSAEVAANSRLLEALARVPLTVRPPPNSTPCASRSRQPALPPSTRSTRTPPTCSPQCCRRLPRQRVPQPGPPGQTLPCRGHRWRGRQAADSSHVTPDRQAPQPWPHHPGQEQSSLSAHRPRLQGHVPAVHFRRIGFPAAFQAAQTA
jgi:hypothetical protein